MLAAVCLGAISVACALGMGLLGYRRSTTDTEKRYHAFYLDKALMLASAGQADANSSGQGALEAIERLYRSLPDRAADEYICVVDRNSRLILHTAHPQTVGNDVGANRIVGGEAAGLASLCDFHTAKTDYAGGYISSSGQEQIAAFAYIPGRDWTLGVHRSKEALAGEVRSGMTVFFIAFFAVCGLLMPTSLVLLYCVFRRAHARGKHAEAEKAQLEAQLWQSQKMEAIGKLAGGVAHDFNNLLTAIMGNAQLLTLTTPRGSEQADCAEEIVKASSRAADLTRQLLAFSRKGALQNVHLNIHDALVEVIGLLNHSIGREIKVVRKENAENPVIDGDPSLLHNAIVNLALNARDAMPDGGTLTFATQNISLDEAQCRQHAGEIRPGEYLEIGVSDTGIGMDAKTQQRVFEPFFTTKAPGKGTGLGLAGVFGCVKSHKGMVRVHSQPGVGSTFKVLLPMPKTAKPLPTPRNDPEPPRVSGRVLIIDDEEPVRRLAARALESTGYTVSTCADGLEGIELFKNRRESVDLVVLDLVMPGIGGKATFAALRRIDPAVRVLVASGFAKSAVVTDVLDEGAVGFLGKPFSIDKLTREVARHIQRADVAAVASSA